MHRGFLKIAALLAAISVGLGAFAAHGLKNLVSARSLEIFETAVKYQFYHVFALFIAGILYKEFSSKLVLWAGRLFIAGIILFSGSLYILSMLEAMVMPGYRWIGAITPIGGVAFITAWILLFVAFFKRK